jgi:putative lipoic acid-binding regulatory protein
MTQSTPLKFPCRFPIKVMGRNGDRFEFEVVRIMRRHVPDLAEGAIKSRASRQQNYASITITIEAQSREQLDAIYRDLSACEQVLMAL